MERYKKTLRKRIAWLGALLAATIGVVVWELTRHTVTAEQSYMAGFRCGVASGLAIGAVLGIVYYLRMLRSDERCRKAFNEENDERCAAIRAKAGMPMLLYTSCAMLLAGMIAGSWSADAFKALTIAAMAQLVIGCAAKLYWTRKL